MRALIARREEYHRDDGLNQPEIPAADAEDGLAKRLGYLTPLKVYFGYIRFRMLRCPRLS